MKEKIKISFRNIRSPWDLSKKSTEFPQFSRFRANISSPGDFYVENRQFFPTNTLSLWDFTKERNKFFQVWCLFLHIQSPWGFTYEKEKIFPRIYQVSEIWQRKSTNFPKFDDFLGVSQVLEVQGTKKWNFFQKYPESWSFVEGKHWIPPILTISREYLESRRFLCGK